MEGRINTQLFDENAEFYSLPTVTTSQGTSSVAWYYDSDLTSRVWVTDKVNQPYTLYAYSNQQAAIMLMRVENYSCESDVKFVSNAKQ